MTAMDRIMLLSNQQEPLSRRLAYVLNKFNRTIIAIEIED
jgi:hypothetical protein